MRYKNTDALAIEEKATSQYINKDTLISMINARANMLIEGKEAFLYVAKWLDLLPTADVVEVRHGVWRLETDEEMPNPMFKLVVCSVCNEKNNATPKYCPHCGAKMERSNENDE